MKFMGNCLCNSKNDISNPSRTFAVMPMKTNGGQLTFRKSSRDLRDSNQFFT